MSNSKSQNELLNPVEIEAQENGRRTWGIFPIAGSEVKKLLCIAGITICLSFAYSSSRELKDAYFLEKMPTTAMSYVKLLFVLPLNILVNITISIMLNKFSVETIFSTLTVFYAIFFAVMGFILIPFRNTLEISVFRTIDLVAEGKIEFYGGLNGIMPIFYLCGYWVISLNYCLIEVFSSTVFAYLMFTFFNYVCEALQFRRFISLIFIFCNISAILSGIVLNIAGRFSRTLAYKGKQKLYYCYFGLVSFLCFMAFVFQYIIDKYYNQNTEKKVVKKKEAPGTLEALKVLLSARVILALSVTVLFYNFLVNIIEMCYKGNLKRYQSVYLNGAESFQEMSSTFNSTSLILTGVLVIIIMLSSLKNSIKTFGWTVVGMITPAFMLFGGLTVFLFSIINFTRSARPVERDSILDVRILSFFYRAKQVQVEPADLTKSMKLNLWISCIIIALFKCCKYAFFDISKESLSMLIDKESRAKYKSIYDGICGKLGKSLSSIYVIFWAGVLGIKEMNEISSIGAAVLILFAITWGFMVVYVGSAYNTSVKTGKPLDLGFVESKQKEIL